MATLDTTGGIGGDAVIRETSLSDARMERGKAVAITILVIAILGALAGTLVLLGGLGTFVAQNGAIGMIVGGGILATIATVFIYHIQKQHASIPPQIISEIINESPEVRAVDKGKYLFNVLLEKEVVRRTDSKDAKIACSENFHLLGDRDVNALFFPTGDIMTRFPNTSELFWKMIWENRVDTIVHHLQCVPRTPQCPMQFSEEFQVKLIESRISTTGILKLCRIHKFELSDGEDKKEVIQYQGAWWWTESYDAAESYNVCIQRINEIIKLVEEAGGNRLITFHDEGIGYNGMYTDWF